jgi:hypothetical protein
MNKSVACFLLGATLLSGCRSFSHRTEGEVHVASYWPGTTVTVPGHGMQRLATNSALVEPPNTSIPSDRHPAIQQDSTKGHPNVANATPTDSVTSTERGTNGPALVRADRGTKNTPASAICQAAVRPADADSPSRSVVPTPKTASIAGMQVPDKGTNVTQAVETLTPDRTSQQNLSGTVWYYIASLGGALFTCILSPLTLDLIRKRLGLNGSQANSTRPQPTYDSAQMNRKAKGANRSAKAG